MNKRKRTEKTVRFDVEHIEIIDTYSAMDYDRGRQPIIQYKINPRKLPQLSLDIPTNIHSESNTSPDSDDSIETPIDKKKQRKPKLTVNTSICTDGPLFFTKLSTNHYKHSINSTSESEEEEDYLVPITPNCI